MHVKKDFVYGNDIHVDASITILLQTEGSYKFLNIHNRGIQDVLCIRQTFSLLPIYH